MPSIKTNFEFPRGDDPLKQGQRLAQDLSTNFKAVVKEFSNISDSMPIGTVIDSTLTAAQMLSVYGENWVLTDGRNVTGSKYSNITGIATVPTLTGIAPIFIFIKIN